MIELTWKVFSKTGCIETYLLLKELEEEPFMYELEKSDGSESSTVE
ncbi:YqzL family protein [Virgibacillus soli]|uniref:YqzL family protein n=1 Tax=Paracerasibacillus soli TaxID=480284 RepID=A0ABU5CQH8_9BACI|nr:YqzL family protein [Virgibacillus soli]MDY0408470.1 YqzL family protein [Virgibacillus soli]